MDDQIYSKSKELCIDSQSQGQSQCRVFSKELKRIKKRVEFYAFDTDKDLAEELCCIIAEVMCLPDGTILQIGKVKLPLKLVQDVFDLISHDHLEHVIIRFRRVAYQIRFPKSYLRTALYNSVFEMTSALDSEVRSILFGGR